MNDLWISLLSLLTARTSIWEPLLGISYEQGIRYHANLGTIAIFTITVHLALWWALWIHEGDWVQKAILRVHDPNVNLVTGAQCSAWETVTARCGTGHFWVIPALELWYFLLGVPCIAILAYHPIRRMYYQAFYYAHHQFLIFYPLAFFHSWGLWKTASFGLALWLLGRITSRIRAFQELEVCKVR